MLFVVAFLLAACGADKTKPGEAVNLTGDPAAGKTVYDANCAKCHGDAGAGGVANPGSEDGSVPALAPIDPESKTAEAMDLTIQHGSDEGKGKAPLTMAAYGDKKLLT